jgi:hypothetical protein
MRAPGFEHRSMMSWLGQVSSYACGSRSLGRRKGFALAGPARRKAALAWGGVGLVATAGILVFWLFDAIPFQDLPAHAGLIAMRHRFAHSTFERQFFVLAPQVGPYSLFRTLGEIFVGPLGPVGAVRLLATLPMVASPVALVWARWRLHRDASPAAAYFGVALGFGFMTLLGFASYLLGIAVLVFAITLWLELMLACDEETQRGPGIPRVVRREVAMAGFAPALFLAHGHAFALFVGIAVVTALAAERPRRRMLRLRSLTPALGLAAWSAWTERPSVRPAGSAVVAHVAFVPHFQGPLDKLSLLFTPTLLTRTGADVVVGILIWIVVLAATVATGRSLRVTNGAPIARVEMASMAHARALHVAAGCLALVFLALPHSIGWFGFVDGRLVPVLLFLLILAVRRPALGPTLAALFDRCAMGAGLAMVVIALAASHAFQKEAAGWRQVLGTVPPDARILNLPVEPTSAVFTAHPFVHYDKLALAEHPEVVSDVWFHQGSAIYPTAANPALALPPTYSESDLRFVDWPAYRLADWDFVLMRTRPTATEPAVPDELTLSAHNGGWWLFRTSRALDARGAGDGVGAP